MIKPAVASLAAIGLLALSAPVLNAQQGAAPPREAPGKADKNRVTAGSYVMDSNHTLITWRVSHFGFNDYIGQFGSPTGRLVIDPARLRNATLDVTIPMSGITTASQGLTRHLNSADFFDSANHPTARFVSTSVRPSGNTARITGNLTIRGITRPVVLNARFVGAGDNPMNRKASIGFHATGSIKRSDFGVSYAILPNGVAMVSDTVALDISAAFEKE